MFECTASGMSCAAAPVRGHYGVDMLACMHVHIVASLFLRCGACMCCHGLWFWGDQLVK
jgi:DNA-binding IclR family transcriptional regulator